MSIATTHLLAALHYDEDGKTLFLDPTAPALANVRDALQRSYIHEPLKVGAVKIDSGASESGAKESLVLYGRATVLKMDRSVYMEFSLAGGVVETALILASLPNQWQLAELFDEPGGTVPEEVKNLRVAGGFVAISSGIYGVAGKRTVGPKKIDLSGYELRNGLQILWTKLVNSADLHTGDVRGEAVKAGIPQCDLPSANENPDCSDAFVDSVMGTLEIEMWWNQEPGTQSTSVEKVNEAGLAIVFSLNDTLNAPRRKWLRRLGHQSAPIVVEAEMSDGNSVRFITRPGPPTPLANAKLAIDAIVGTSVFQLLPDPPGQLALSLLIYAPTEGLRLTVLASDLEHTVPLGAVELREIRFTIGTSFDRSQKDGNPSTPPRVEIEGLVEIFGVTFDVKGSPGSYIQGGLLDSNGVHVGSLLSQALPDGVPFDLDTVSVSAAWVRHTFGDEPEETSLELELLGEVKLLPAGALTLREIDLQIHHENDSNTGQISAVLELGPVVLRVIAAKDDEGWVFSGSIGDSAGISLTKLVDHLVHAWGASVPTHIPEVDIDTLALRYRPASQTLEIRAAVDWKVEDVPVISGDNQAILDLTVTRDRARGGHTASLVTNWTHTKNEHAADNSAPITLSAYAALARDAQSFGFDYSAEQDASSLTELMGPLELDTVLPKFVAGALDELFQVSHLSADYARPGNHLSLAWTRPLGDGVFLSEFSTASSGRDIKATWSPSEPGDSLALYNVLSMVGLKKAENELTSALKSIGLDRGVQAIEALLTFKRIGFNWKADGTNQSLTLLAESASKIVHEAYVLVPESASGFAVGLVFADGMGLKDLPFLPSAVHEFFNIVTLEPRFVQISTVKAGRVTPPPFSESALEPDYLQTGIGDSNLKKKDLFGQSTPLPVGEGVAIGVRIPFTDKSVVRRVVDADYLDGTLLVELVNNVPTAAVQMVLPGTLKFAVGGGNSLALGNAMLRIKVSEGNPEFDVGGSLDLKLFGHRIDAAGWLSLNPEGVEIHLSLSGIELPPPLPYLPGVHFEATADSPLSLDGGIQFEPPGLDLGLQASFFIWTVGKVYNGKVSFVLEVVDIVPVPLYVEFSLDALDMAAILEALTGVQYALHLAEEVANTAAEHLSGDAAKDASKADSTIQAIQGMIQHVECILHKVQLQDVIFRWSDDIVALPDGSTALPGVSFQGALKIFDWSAFALLSFSTAGVPALTGKFEADEFKVGKLVKISGNGKGIRKTSALPQATPTAPSGQLASDSNPWLIKPGGPVFIVSTKSSPFLHADLHVDILGVFVADVTAEVSDEGFVFEFDFVFGASQANHAKVDWECHYWRDDNVLEAHGNLSLALHGKLGPIISDVPETEIELDATLEAHAAMRVSKDGFMFKFHGQFEYRGTVLTFPELPITKSFSSIEELTKNAWDHLEKYAEHIFRDVVAPVEKYAKEAAKEIVAVAEEASKDVSKVAQETRAEIQGIATSAAALVSQDTTDLEEEATNARNKVKDILGGAEKEAKDTADRIVAAAEKLEADCKALEDDAKQVVEDIAGDAKQYCQAAETEIIDVANKAEHYAEKVKTQAEDWVCGRLADAAALAENMAVEATRAVRAIQGEIDKLSKEISHLGSEIASLGRSVWRGAKSAVSHLNPFHW